MLKKILLLSVVSVMTSHVVFSGEFAAADRGGKFTATYSTATYSNEEIVNCIKLASKNGQVDVLDSFLAEANQRGMKIRTHDLYDGAIINGHIHIVSYLIRRPHGLPALTQDDVSNIFYLAAIDNHKHIMMYLLNPSNGLPSLDQDAVNGAFGASAMYDRSTMMYLLNESDKIGLPNESGANEALIFSINHRRFENLRYILGRPKGIPLPNQERINDYYRKIVDNAYYTKLTPEETAEAISILRPYVSPEVVRQYEPDFIPPQKKKKSILGSALNWGSNQPVAVR